MVCQCVKCDKHYDDEKQWTICPHGPLAFPLSDFCPRCDTVKGIHGPCRHQLEDSERDMLLCGAGGAGGARGRR